MPLSKPPEQPTFVMTVNCNRDQLKSLVESGGIQVMRNVMQFNSKNGLSVRQPYADNYVLDSGGYTAMDEFGGDFPWTVTEYHQWAKEMYETHPFQWVATMDLACEPAFDDVISVSERIERTVNNTIDLLEHDPEYPVLPVLQGREVEQWLDCYDRLRDHGINPEFAGIGTLCRQTSGYKIKEIVRALRTRTDIDAFHGFGVKSTAFKAGVKLESADSQAWSWPVKYGIQLQLTNDTPPKLERVDVTDESEDVHKKSFNAYYQYTSRLQQEAYTDCTTKQTVLFQ